MKKEILAKPFKFKFPIILIGTYCLGIASLMGKPSPMAIGLMGGLNGTECLTAFVGASVGFLVSNDFVMAIPLIIAAAAVCVLRLLFGKIKNKAGAFGSAALTGSALLVTSSITAQSVSDIFTAALFGIVSAICSYSSWKIGYQLKKGEGFFPDKAMESVPAGISAVFMIASFASLHIGIFNIGAIMSAAAVLVWIYRFRFGGIGAGVVCALGLAVGLENQTTSAAAALTLAAGAVIAAVTVPKGRLVQATSFLFTALISGTILGMSRDMLAFGINMLVGSAVFAALPLNSIMDKVMSDGLVSSRYGSPTEVFSGRLELVGNTMGELRYALEKTAEALDGGVNKDVTQVYNSACDQVCRNCRFNIKCWGDEYNDSAAAMNRLLGILRQGEKINPDSFSGSLSTRCQRKQQLCDAISKKYEDFAAAKQMNRRISEMRGILTKQLENTEKMFNVMAEEFASEITYDAESAVRAERVLERCGIAHPRAAVKIIEGKMIVEAYGVGKLTCTAEELGDLLIEALKREFDLPFVLEFGKKIRITAFQRADYGIKTALCQLSRKRDTVSGDYATGCFDGKGNYYGIMSDGMGSGTRARVDSAFACGLLSKLIESGIGAETAAEMLNTSLMVKSSDESFATLDICKINLYTGKTIIYKAGASDTFIRSGSSITKIKGGGLPAGVNSLLTMPSYSFTIGEDDVVLMTSDGAELSENWLGQAFEKESGKDIEQLVKTVAGAARFNAEKGREDDISVMALQLKK